MSIREIYNNAMKWLINSLYYQPHYFLNRCTYCHVRKAEWWHGPSPKIACDKCVPRGCSCNQDLPIDNDNIDPATYPEMLDEKGRKYPCCEWCKMS